jgi:hypothetical protein
MNQRLSWFFLVWSATLLAWIAPALAVPSDTITVRTANNALIFSQVIDELANGNEALGAVINPGNITLNFNPNTFALTFQLSMTGQCAGCPGRAQVELLEPGSPLGAQAQVSDVIIQSLAFNPLTNTTTFSFLFQSDRENTFPTLAGSTQIFENTGNAQNPFVDEFIDISAALFGVNTQPKPFLVSVASDVPEPGTLTLLTFGLVLLPVARRYARGLSD